MTGLISSALNTYADSSRRAWATDRSQTVGASEVGQCARKVFWLKNEGDPKYGAPRDPEYQDSWGATARGSTYENHFWEPALRSVYGDRLLFAGADQQTFVSGFLSATPDGMLTQLQPGQVAEGSGAEVMAECKTADPRTNLTEAKSENVYQTHIQMGLIRELTPYKPTHSILSYTDASFWNEVKEFVIPFDEKIFEAGKARAAMIMTATSAADLKPEGWIAGGRDCNYCPFTRACGIQRRSLPFAEQQPVDPQFAAEITDMARAIKQLESQRDHSDEQVRALQDEVRNRLREKGVRKIPGVLTWSAVKGRSSYDNKAIQAAATEAGIDLTQFEKVGEPTDRLVISLPADAESATQANAA
jgi:hypothetical protein